MRRPDVHVHVEELVLHGFEPADRNRIGAAVQQELARLVTERGVASREREGPLSTSINLPANPPARIVGTRVARALFGVLRR